MRIKTGKTCSAQADMQWSGTVEVSFPVGAIYALDKGRKEDPGGLRRVECCLASTAKVEVFAINIPRPGTVDDYRWTTLDGESSHYLGSRLSCREVLDTEGNNPPQEILERTRRALNAGS